MSFRLRKSDCKTLEYLAEYRVLTVSQLAAIFQKNKPAVRKRIRDLRKEDLVEVASNEYGHNFGRPESLLMLTEQGINILKGKDLIAKDEPYENVGPVSPRLIDHQLLLNWFRIDLNQIERVIPRLCVRFLSYSSPFGQKKPDGRAVISDYSPIGCRAIQEVRFTPDAVFATTDKVEKKTLLFFLEVDCGTETLSSPQRDMTDIRQKILNYQWYFQSLKYKRYKKIFEASHLQGFRLLFLTKTAGRLAALCKLTQQMEPSQFIWLTEQSRMFNGGVSGKIWARGGNLQTLQQSILGRLDCSEPLPL